MSFDLVSYTMGMASGGGGGGGSTNVLTGTSAPASALGSNGDMYLQYSQLPAGYTPLEYIQSSGTQYISTRYIPSVYTTVALKLNSQMIQDSAIFGSEWALNGFFLMFYDAKFRWHSSDAVNSYTITENTDYTVKANVTGLEVNGTRYAATPGGAVATPIRIFSTTTPGGGSSSNRKGSFKLYYFSAYESGRLMLHMIPVKRNSDNALGLYDLLGGEFYGNGGTGNFTAGPEHAYTYAPIVSAYAKVEGAWQELIGTDINDIRLGS